MLKLGCRRGSAATGVRAAVGFRIVVGVVVTIVVCAAVALTPGATAAFASIGEAPAASPAEAGASVTDASPAEAPLTVPARSALGLGLSMFAPGVPFVGAALYTDNVAFLVEGIEAVHSLFDFDARTRVIVASARYRLPLAWNDWRPYGDVGFVSVRSDVSGLNVSAWGFTVGAGVERPLNESGTWRLRSEARYVKLLDRPHWLVGAGLEWRFPLPEGTAGPALGAGGTAGSGRAAAAGSAAAVHASGTISRISLPMSASGRWEFSADLVRGTASVYLEGTVDGESGAIAFSNATRVSFSGSSVSATFEERDTHEGKPVRAVISLSVSERGFSLSITARRSDGLSASASVSGRTSRFEVVPLPRPAAAGAGEADSTTTDGTEPDITKADGAAADDT